MFLKGWEILRDDYKSVQNPLKILAKKQIFGRVTGLKPQLFRKWNPSQVLFKWLIYTLWAPPMTIDRKRKILKFNV